MKPFYIDDLAALREKLARAERDDQRIGRVWRSMRQWVAADPQSVYWHAPFVALVTGDTQAVEAAKAIIRSYVDSLATKQFSMGLQFHFWCMSFPHARWAMYFQWLDSIGAWEPEEAERLRQRLLEYQFINFFYGLRTKPEPECADNQAMSLAFSNGLLGTLFDGAIADRIRADGLRRLPDTIGGLEPSGYSGEGSTYMSHVVAPCLPFVIELLNTHRDDDLFAQPLPPEGCSGEAICRMIARSTMPGGYLLPWDHYGYITGTRACLSYAARKTNDPWYLSVLEEMDWSHEESGGWGLDDLVWSLVWWPDKLQAASGPVITGWMQPGEGAALVSNDSQLYLMQMWDRSAPGYPTRQHVNPNALVLAAHGIPLTLDGVPDEGCTAFDFEDTWKVIRNADFNVKRSNFGSGCGGAHNVLLVDGWEGMRASEEYPQSELLEYDAETHRVATDVTPIYHERWPDAIRVARRSRLCHDRFWLIEDLAAFAEEHEVTARFYLRHTLVRDAQGVTIETPEGVRLQLLPVLGPDTKATSDIDGYPRGMDGRSLRVDFTQRGSECRWLWVAWPQQARRVLQELSDGWDLVADTGAELSLDSARDALDAGDLRLAFTEPAPLLADVEIAPRWWYRRTLDLPAEEALWLRLPHDMVNAALWVNGEAVDLSVYEPTARLIDPRVDISAFAGRQVEIIVRTDTPIDQRGAKKDSLGAFTGRPQLLGATSDGALEAAHYADGIVTVKAAGRTWRVDHDLLPTEGTL